MLLHYEVLHFHNIVFTLASHSSILWVAVCTGDIGVMWTFNEVTFTATAVNIVQVDWTSASTKMSIAEGQCTCWWRLSLPHLPVKLMHATDLEWSTPTLDTQQRHHCYPRSHHRQYPTHCSCILPLCLHLQGFLPLVAVDQLYMALVYENK